ncbi:unnamed protein product [Linum tenue]|uniref:SMARCC C-terminal domain-containing protein n=1 Tax=Linum tenue TaxID=586396 RepID=A0AAV0IDG1_9ROSI|nr:unnamed protein product [Linum tenue]
MENGGLYTEVEFGEQVGLASAVVFASKMCNVLRRLHFLPLLLVQELLLHVLMHPWQHYPRIVAVTEVRMNADQVQGRQDNNNGEIADSVHQNEIVAAALSAEKVKAAARAGLAAAATKAKLFADHEEREIQRLSAIIINHQLKRLELKLKQFAEVETLLMRECEQVEKMRQRFSTERARMKSTDVGSSLPMSHINRAGVDPSSMPANNMVNNIRPQMMPTTSSQPIVAGYGNNSQQQQQVVHPHMPFMQRGQSMFSMGPRLPLSAIQPSSSGGQANVMFNASSGNTQPNNNLNQILRSVSGPSSGLG